MTSSAMQTSAEIDAPRTSRIVADDTCCDGRRAAGRAIPVGVLTGQTTEGRVRWRDGFVLCNVSRSVAEPTAAVAAIRAGDVDAVGTTGSAGVPGVTDSVERILGFTRAVGAAASVSVAGPPDGTSSADDARSGGAGATGVRATGAAGAAGAASAAGAALVVSGT
jgi:hypothetical protein